MSVAITTELCLVSNELGEFLCLGRKLHVKLPSQPSRFDTTSTL